MLFPLHRGHGRTADCAGPAAVEAGLLLERGTKLERPNGLLQQPGAHLEKRRHTCQFSIPGSNLSTPQPVGMDQASACPASRSKARSPATLRQLPTFGSCRSTAFNAVSYALLLGECPGCQTPESASCLPTTCGESTLSPQVFSCQGALTSW